MHNRELQNRTSIKCEAIDTRIVKQIISNTQKMTINALMPVYQQISRENVWELQKDLYSNQIERKLYKSGLTAH